MKTVYKTLVIAALAAFGASPAMADMTNQPSGSHYTTVAPQYGPSHNNYHGVASSYGPSHDNYNGTQHYSSAPKTGSPSPTIAKQASMESFIPY